MQTQSVILRSEAIEAVMARWASRDHRRYLNWKSAYIRALGAELAELCRSVRASESN